MCSGCDWETGLEEIEECLDDPDYEFAEDTLEGIKEWVEHHEHITEKQQEAIDNIIDSKGE